MDAVDKWLEQAEGIFNLVAPIGDCKGDYRDPLTGTTSLFTPGSVLVKLNVDRTFQMVPRD